MTGAMPMRACLPALALAFIAGCAAPPPRPAGIDPAISAEMARTAERRPEPRPEAVESALLPPLRMEMPRARGLAAEQRFDLSVSNAPAAQVFMSLVSGTRQSMLVHPSVSGTITINLKDVTIEEALLAIRELYGYEYRIDGARIYIPPTGLQTRVFQVNYLPGQRRGSTEVRVTSGADSGVSGGTGGATATTTSAAPGTTGASGIGGRGRESTRVTTEQQATFWPDLCDALAGIVFPPEQRPRQDQASSNQPEDRQRHLCNRRHADSERSIVVSPHSGVIVVRATASELRAVDSYLRATRLAVERQVMLEAKIVEVELAEAYQAGINWAAFRNSGPNLAVGQITGSTGNPTVLGSRGQLQSAQGVTVDATGRVIRTTKQDQNTNQLALAAGAAVAALPGGAIFGLALQTSNFAALLEFLQSHGNVQVLSSPRIATLNNQKALLKVGSEELFVSDVTVTPATSTSGGTTQLPTVAPRFATYFSGIVLDVTPQIDDNNNITLHIHPSVSEVTQTNREINLGSGSATTIPTATNKVSETDTIVRVTDGNIVAIGGLMKVEIRDSRGGLPGVSEGGLGNLFRNTSRQHVKKELVILLKPTVIQSDRNWEQDLRETRGRLESLGAPAGRPQGPGAR